MRVREPQRTGRPEHVDGEAERAPEPPVTAEAIRALQRSAGNAAVGRLLAHRSIPVLAREPEIEPTDKEMGEYIVDSIDKVNGPKSVATGVHYPFHYHAKAQKSRRAKAFWKDEYWKGYANPDFWTQPAHMAWQLLPGVSAAAAIQDWLKGLTIAECASVLVAIQLNTIRAAVGDDRFDELFSTLHGEPERGLLRVNQLALADYSRTAEFMTTTYEKVASAKVTEAVGKRSVRKGEWYYFFNHPKYLLKHPEGVFQGENAVCVDDAYGKQRYAGFGVNGVTEQGMLDIMAKAYNNPRTERDFEWLVKKFAPDAAAARKPSQKWEELYDAVPPWNVSQEYLRYVGYPDQISGEDVVNAPECTVKGETRKGGFVIGGGKKLDPALVAGARQAPVVI